MSDLVCWKCGAGLRGVLLPLSRRAECPACRAELHACAMCRLYDARRLRPCLEERAEAVRDPRAANFCDYFKPRPDAFGAGARAKADDAKARADALFGGDAKALDKTDQARRKLDELFAGGKDKPKS